MPARVAALARARLHPARASTPSADRGGRPGGRRRRRRRLAHLDRLFEYAVPDALADTAVAGGAGAGALRRAGPRRLRRRAPRRGRARRPADARCAGSSARSRCCAPGCWRCAGPSPTGTPARWATCCAWPSRRATPRRRARWRMAPARAGPDGWPPGPVRPVGRLPRRPAPRCGACSGAEPAAAVGRRCPASARRRRLAGRAGRGRARRRCRRPRRRRRRAGPPRRRPGRRRPIEGPAGHRPARPADRRPGAAGALHGLAEGAARPRPRAWSAPGPRCSRRCTTSAWWPGGTTVTTCSTEPRAPYPHVREVLAPAGPHRGRRPAERRLHAHHRRPALGGGRRAAPGRRRPAAVRRAAAPGARRR